MQRRISNFLLALIGFLFLVCGSVTLVLNCRQLYAWELQQLNLGDELGLSETVLMDNYNALIDYNLAIGGTDRLEFPDFPMSEHGRIHFEEVKVIFVWIQYLCWIMGLLFLVGSIWKLKRHEYRFLKSLAIMTWVIPAVLGTLIALFWDQVFVIFHKIFFANDYWLFDPVTDPVILILPDEFFAHCAVAILLLVAAGGVVSLIVYQVLKRHSSTRTRSRKR